MTRLTLRILQEAREAPDLPTLLRSCITLFEEVAAAANGGDALLRIFSYLARVRAAEDLAVLHAITVQLKQGTDMQTIAEMWEEQGIQKGRQEGLQTGLIKGRQEGIQTGRQEGQRELLARQLVRKFGNLPPSIEVRLMEADAADLLRWAENVVVAANLDDVFADLDRVPM